MAIAVAQVHLAYLRRLLAPNTVAFSFSVHVFRSVVK